MIIIVVLHVLVVDEGNDFQKTRRLVWLTYWQTIKFSNHVFIFIFLHLSLKQKLFIVL